jgi:hypothetical protein
MKQRGKHPSTTIARFAFFVVRAPELSSQVDPDSHVKYPGIIFDKRITWRLHIEMIGTKSFRTYITILSYSKVSV